MDTDVPGANLTTWVYQRLGPGQFQRLSRKRWDAWSRGEAAIKPDSSGFVHTAVLSMWFQNRRVLGVHAIHLYRSKVNPQGIRTEEIINEESFAWMCTTFDQQKSTGPVVNAAGRFGVGQFKWKPTRSDVLGLCQVVNQRARTVLLAPGARK